MFTCSHCGRQTAVFGADQCDTIDMGRVHVNAAQNTIGAYSYARIVLLIPSSGYRSLSRNKCPDLCNRLQTKELTLTLRSFYKTNR
jgi:hypothetical protein